MNKLFEIFILAGRDFEAHDFAKQSGFKKDSFTYVFSARDLNGKKGQVLLLVGSHYERNDNQYLIDVAKARDFVIINCVY